MHVLTWTHIIHGFWFNVEGESGILSPSPFTTRQTKDQYVTIRIERIPPEDYRAIQNNGNNHLAIKNTRLRRLMTMLALRTMLGCYKLDGFVWPVLPNLIIKAGPWIHLTEAATMQYIATRTSILVLKDLRGRLAV